MKTFLLYFLILFTCFKINAQISDSIPYEYGNLHFRTYGNKGENIIILSGGPGNNALQLEPMAAKLGEQNKVVLLEQRGTGNSIPEVFNNKTINLNAAVNDITRLIEYLALKDVVLIGHSYGASLALIYCSKYPEKIKSCIMVSPGSGIFDMYLIAVCNIESRLGKDEVHRWLELYYEQDNMDSIEKKEFNYLNRLAYVYDKSKLDYLMPLINGSNNKKTFEILSANLENYGDTIYRDLKSIKSPIHIVSGRQDIFAFMPYELKLKNTDIKLNWIDQCGHFPMFEAKNEFYSILDKILKEN